jgi:hypothetical protein
LLAPGVAGEGYCAWPDADARQHQLFAGSDNGLLGEAPAGDALAEDFREPSLIGAGTSEIRRMLIGRELFAKTA